ncbi:MAG: hypothetical protein WAW41_04075 [Methylobacter sp.]
MAAILLFPALVFADTYNALDTSYYSCSNQGDHKESTLSALADWYTAHNAPGTFYYSVTGPLEITGYYSVTGGSHQSGDVASINACYLSHNYSCPYGGNVSGTNCINAPACVSPEIRNPITGQCQVPATCSSFESIDPNTNTCVLVTCPDGQIFLSSSTNPTGGCVNTPSACLEGGQICSSVEQYCGNENGSFTVTPACPTKTCASDEFLAADGKTCAKNAQLSCPADQHASSDNTTCVADDPTACPSGTYSGTVNGVKKCIQGTNPHSDGSDVDTTKGTVKTKQEDSTSTSTTVTNPDGSTTTTTTTSNGATTSELTLDTSGLAQDSSIQAINDTLNKTSSKTPFNKSGSGTAPADDYQTQIGTKKQELQTMISGIKSQFAGLTPTLSGGGGSMSCDDGVSLPGLNITFRICLADYQQYFSIIGNSVYVVAAAAALFIILG